MEALICIADAYISYLKPKKRGEGFLGPKWKYTLHSTHAFKPEDCSPWGVLLNQLYLRWYSVVLAGPPDPPLPGRKTSNATWQAAGACLVQVFLPKLEVLVKSLWEAFWVVKTPGCAQEILCESSPCRFETSWWVKFVDTESTDKEVPLFI